MQINSTMIAFFVKNNMRRKIVNLYQVIQNEGIRKALKKCIKMLRYHFRDRWNFVYFEYSLHNEIFHFPIPEYVRVKVATMDDIKRIENDIFPFLIGELEYEKRYFKRIGDKGVQCFLAEKDGKIIHYTWFFSDVFCSPLMQTPFDKKKMREGDVFFGPAFTNPSARGIAVYPVVIAELLSYAKKQMRASRALLFVYGKNRPAVNFFSRLGFKEMEDIQVRGVGYFFRVKYENFIRKFFGKVKEIAGRSCLIFVNFFVRKRFFRLRDAFLTREHKEGFLYVLIEKIVNSLNRRLLTEDLKKSGVHYLSDRHEPWYKIHEYIFNTYIKEPVDYLEFGVYEGQSIRWYLSKLTHESNLYGFDSFEGLPEKWISYGEKGRFNCDGNIPDITAPNLRFIKGWFEESLELFLGSAILKPRLVIHVDADLYSSTLFVLRTMRQFFTPGTVIIFDEYWVVKDEFKALNDFVAEAGKKFEYLAISDTRAAIHFIV